MDILENLVGKNGLVVAFLFVGITMYIANWMSRKVLNKRIPGVAIAIVAARFYYIHRTTTNNLITP